MGGGLLGIRDTSDGSSFVQVPGTKCFVLQRKLAGGGTEHGVGEGKLGTNGEVLGSEGADRRTAGRFCVAVVQYVLLIGTETWLVTPQLEKAPKGFHHKAVQRMAGMVPKRQQYGTCVVIFF